VRQGRINAPRTQPLTLTMMRQRLAYTVYEQAMIVHELLVRFQAPPFTGQLDNGLRVATWQQRRAAAEHVLAQPETPAALAALYQQAIAAAPDDWVLARNFGMALVALGSPDDAIPWLE